MKPLTHEDVVVVTGNNGLLGSALVRALGDRGDPDADGHIELRSRVPQLVGLDRDGQPQPPPHCECIFFDVTRAESVDRGLRRLAWQYGRRIAALVHLAAYYDFSGDDSPLYDEVTLQGTRRVVRTLQAQGFEVERFLFSSTMLVHAPCEVGERIDESSPLAPAWPYPVSKLRTEQMLREIRDGMPVTMLRIAGVYTDRCDSIPLSHQIRRIHQKDLKSRLYPADLRVGQAYVHLDDTVTAILGAIEHRDSLPDESAYLIGEPETLGYGDLQQRLGELLHGREHWKTLQVPPPLARAGAAVEMGAAKLPGVSEPMIRPWMVERAGDHYALDIRAAESDLEWSPRHRLSETLPDMVEALRADPAGWYRRHDLGDPPG